VTLWRLSQDEKTNDFDCGTLGLAMTDVAAADLVTNGFFEGPAYCGSFAAQFGAAGSIDDTFSQVLPTTPVLMGTILN